jgi:hypothetical protein
MKPCRPHPRAEFTQSLGGRIVHLSACIDIQASPAKAFGLLCDPARKARLNPAVTVLEAALVSPGPMGRGARLRYRLRMAGGIAAFGCEVTEFEPDRLIEFRSQSPVPFRLRQGVDPRPDGCRLWHEESAEIACPTVGAAAERRTLPYLLRLFGAGAGLFPLTPAVIEELQEETIADEMSAELAAWLANIKADLESAGAETGPCRPETTRIRSQGCTGEGSTAHDLRV